MFVLVYCCTSQLCPGALGPQCSFCTTENLLKSDTSIMGVEDGSDRRSTTAPHHTKERPSSKKGNILWYFFCAVVCRIDTTVKWVVVCIEVEDLYGT